MEEELIKITPNTPLPPQIVEAVNNDTLAVFVGAGVSRIIGCKGWDQLARNLVEKCYSLKNSEGKSCINYKDKETLLEYVDHKKTITICNNILVKNGAEQLFIDELKNSLESMPDLLKTRNIYKELSGIRGLFITTNADTHFDGYFNADRMVYRLEEFDPSNIDRTNLYHIHGSILDPKSLILTVPQYFNRYQEPLFRQFLEEIFERYTVLFLGYGLAEFELLDFVITKFDVAKKKDPRHFILHPFYFGEESKLKFEKTYFNTMGVEVLPYALDEKGYGQLFDTIKTWNVEINQTSNYLYDSFKDIDEVVNDFETKKAKKVLQIIRNDKPQKDYFFKALSKTNNTHPWLKLLSQEGYFDPSKLMEND